MDTTLSEFIAARRDEIVAHWTAKVVERLRIPADQRPQLVNDLPEFLDELVVCLRTPPETWERHEGAEAHGRQRIELGIDIGALAEEFGMVAEAICELAAARELRPALSELAALQRLIARGAASSVREYARLRDRETARQAAQHYAFVAHELRTPLQTARVAGHLLAAGQGDGELLHRKLLAAHDELVQRIDDSLASVRLAAEPRLRLEPLRTGELVAAAIERAGLLAERNRVEVRFEGEDVALVADRSLLVSALVNLIVNGIKFSSAGGHVIVRNECADDRLLLEVDDSCGGLPDDLPARLFQPFVQAGADRSGFGLGLAIVKQAVEAHGGAVRVVNRPPDGCRFVIELPATACER